MAPPDREQLAFVLLASLVAAPLLFFAACCVLSGLAAWDEARPSPVGAAGAQPVKIECVVVCVDYSDFLAWTLPANKQHFDQMVVVTHPDDEATRRLCEFWHVRCVLSDSCRAGGARFNKGAMINAGLDALDRDGWVVHADADVFLPPLFRSVLEKIELDVESLYGMDRLMCDDFVSWLRFYCAPQTLNENDVFVHLRPFPVGVRVAKCDGFYGGWLPLGYFQLFHGKRGLRYPESHADAGRTDMLFAMQFPRLKRRMLAELVCVHLETKLPKAAMGANWNGRRTPRFGAEILGGEEVAPTQEASEDYGGVVDSQNVPKESEK